jgi:protein TonB
MFENSLLESSRRWNSVLFPIHYSLSALLGTFFFTLRLRAFPSLPAVSSRGALFITAGAMGAATAFYTLILCYVWSDARQQHLHQWPWLAFTLLLNLPGFLIYLAYSAKKSGDWKRAAMPLAYVAQSALVGVLILVPLICTQALPAQRLHTFHLPLPPGRPPAQATGRPAAPHHSAVNPLTAPVSIPAVIAHIAETPESPQEEVRLAGPFVPGVPSGLGFGSGYVPGGVPWEAAAPVPPPKVPSTVPRQQIYRVGGDVIAAQALYQPPVYPPLAIMARIQGTVVLQAVLGKDGTVRGLKVLSGPPLLARAALEAVKSWRYQPTLLNSEPVEVLTEIEVKFSLSD